MMSSTSSLLPTAESNPFGSEEGEESRLMGKMEKYVQLVLPRFKIKSFAGYLSILQILVFMLTTVVAVFKTQRISSITRPDSCTLYDFGASFAPAVRYHYQVHRVFMPMLLHGSIFHLAVNVFSQIQLLLLIEASEWITKANLILFYCICGVYASIGSMVTNPSTLSVGASGALYGLLAFLVVDLKLRWESLDEQHRRNRAINLAIILSLNIFVSMGSPVIDGSAHFYGFLAGLLWSLPLIKLSGHLRESSDTLGRDRMFMLPLGSGISLLVVLLLGFFFFNIPDTHLNC